jgi:hypothetical protein
VEEFDHIEVGWVGAEVLLQEAVDGRLEEEGIVDSDHAHAGTTVPARFAAARHGAVHDIIGDEEEGLQKLDCPAQKTELFELLVGKGLVQESERGVGNGYAAIELAAGRVGIENLFQSRRCQSKLELAAQEIRIAEKDLTFWYHSKAAGGIPYLLASSRRSSTSEGKTDSKSFRVVRRAMALGIFGLVDGKEISSS